MHLFFLFLSNFVVQSSFVNPKIKGKHEESHHGLLTNYSLRYLMEDYAKKVDCYESLTNYSLRYLMEDYAKNVDCYESFTNYPLRYCAKKHILQHANLLANSSLLPQAKTLNIVARKRFPHPFLCYRKIKR